MSATRQSIDYRPHRLRALWNSSIGKKYVVAVTGLILAIFIVLHMLGNLKAIEGPGHGNAALDRYSHFLRTAGSPALPHNFALWILRIVMITALVLHVTAITQLTIRNNKAKPGRMGAKPIRSSFAARSMRVSGGLILFFLVFHILQFTTRTIHPTPLYDGTVYYNAYHAFHDWWIVVLYVVAVCLLGLHLNHALWSGAQTAGVDNPDRNWFWRRLATGITVLTVCGFASVPLLFAFDALPAPGYGNTTKAAQVHTP
jgi:succinate dehydrogenase / fumarate reductase cytochrome b subunit